MGRTVILIPAYNEAGGIASVIAAIRKSVGPDVDIVVVNDGSSDNTAEVAVTAGALVVSHPFNMGYGVAIQTGYKFAAARRYDYLVQIDADGQHDPACIDRLLDEVRSGRTDLALGSRFLEPGSYRPPFARRVGMIFFGTLVSLLIGRRISDPTSGFQAFNRSVIEYFTGDAFPCDYPDADVLLMIGLAGFSISEIPVRMYANSEGKSMHSGLKPIYYVFKMLLSMTVTLLRHRAERNRKGR